MSGDSRAWLIFSAIAALVILGVLTIVRMDGHEKQETQRQIAKTCEASGSRYAIVGRDDTGSVVMGCK